MNRRAFLASLTAAAAAAPASEALAPVRAITKGPEFHWFGYYDKLQFDPTSRYALGVANNFQHRLPTPDDALKVGMVDLQDGDKWIELGESRAWSWHMTCQVQWIPGSRDEVIWNERKGTDFFAQILNVRTRQKRTLPKPIYCLSPDGKWALLLDFARSFSMRPETGYAGGVDPYGDDLAPAKSGIWRMDLKTGQSELIVSFADMTAIPPRHGDWTGQKHYFTHMLVAPGGKRFTFWHRWAKGVSMPPATRVFTADAHGKNLRLLADTGHSSHNNWRDAETLLQWTNQPSHGNNFYLIDDRTVKYQPLDPEVMNVNGHPSYLPGGRWLLCDTPPDKKERKQHIYLYDTKTRRKVELGAFYSPPEYTGVVRCDTTPRFSPDGRKVIIDSPHDGKGRQMYLIDISRIVQAT